jgi:methyl-accepting chemotaxis protein
LVAPFAQAKPDKEGLEAMSDSAPKAGWFMNMSSADKLRLLTAMSLFTTLLVSGVSAISLVLNQASWSFIALPIVVAVLSTGYAIFTRNYVLHQIITPFEDVSTGLTQIAEGIYDLEIKHTERGDEIGDMARALVKAKEAALMLKELREESVAQHSTHAAMLARLAAKFENDVSEVVGGVAAAAEQLQSSAGAMAATAEQSSNQTGEVSEAMSTAAAGVTAAAAASDEFSVSINEISRQASSSAQLARKATDAAREADKTISALTESAAEVGQIVELISSIAQRTNLLALNASIEAARGGEAGRGFAVVASEVKELAAQTAKATERVAVQIHKIQETTGISVSALQAIADQIGQLELTSVSIASAVDQQSVAGQDLARSIDLAARSTENVSSSVSQVREVSLATGAAASQVLSSSSELKQQAAALHNQVNEFLNHVREAA